MEENENTYIDNDFYNFIDETHVRNLIYEKILRDKKEKITLNVYRNLIIDTPESKDFILDKARNIAKIEIEARREAKKNVCGLFLNDCGYCPIIGQLNIIYLLLFRWLDLFTFFII